MNNTQQKLAFSTQKCCCDINEIACYTMTLQALNLVSDFVNNNYVNFTKNDE